MLAQLINNPTQHNDGQVGDGVYVAYQWILRDNAPQELCRIYLGTRQCGPMLQYDHPGRRRKHYNGRDEDYYRDGAWTPIYSRGNFYKNYACGGNWSGHSRNLHQSIAKLYDQPDKTISQRGIIAGDNILEVPRGVEADVVLTSMDCSGSWSIFYNTAADAMRYRLDINEIATASLPKKSKDHLLIFDTVNNRDKLMEVINAYKL